MATGNTIFITYVLIPTGKTNGEGYHQPIHCNYIKKLQAVSANPYITEINLNFPDSDDFKFLNPNISTGTGYTMNCIHAVVQIVNNSSFSTVDDVVPDSTKWKYFDITDQVSDYTDVGDFYLTPANLTAQVFKIPFYNYTGMTSYNLNYLDYPSSSQEDSLSFGDVTYFFGNLTTKIKADVYTTDIGIDLPLNEFNSSTNLSWNGSETVYISEVGIYDSNRNLVAIGKLNAPVAKDSTISRTIVFALDF
jgi:hypothetical protein